MVILQVLFYAIVSFTRSPFRFHFRQKRTLSCRLGLCGVLLFVARAIIACYSHVPHELSATFYYMFFPIPWTRASKTRLQSSSVKRPIT